MWFGGGPRGKGFPQQGIPRRAAYPVARKRARPVRAGGRWKRTRTGEYLANGLPVPRAIVGHRWGIAEDTVRLASRAARGARGPAVPALVYVDNGSAFVDSWLLRACANLGIKLVHSAPGRPQGRGKIERFFRTVNGEFVVEIAAGDGEPGRQVSDLAEMNRLFTAWVETVYHRRVHSETAAAPLPRWLDGGPYPVPAPADLAEAFRWSEHRTVSKTALVSLHGNRYEVNPGLVGRKVELVLSGSPDALRRRGPLRTGRAGFPRTSAQASPTGVAGCGAGFLRLRT